jgi:hypothetical protein
MCFGPTAFIKRVINANIQTLKEDHIIIILDPVVHLIFNPGTKGSTIFIAS